jgi:hypothetical protein
MESELIEYKRELHLDIDITSELEQVFSETAFFSIVTEQLQDASVLDDVQDIFFLDTAKGRRIDGYSWNPLEGTVCGIITLLSPDQDRHERLIQSEALKLAERVRRFFEAAALPKFLTQCDPSHDAHSLATFLQDRADEILKFRIVILTDYVLSDRVKSIAIDPISDTKTSVEMWDLNRLYSLVQSDTQTEPFVIGDDFLGAEGLPVFKGADLPNGATAYIGVMPGEVLAEIYDEYGQRLLEGNVRTFLDFRGGVNRGLRKTLVTEPENFFAYNNGVTLTADSAVVRHEENISFINGLENLQIVNGGQTTAAIYFAPRESGGVQTSNGLTPYRSIDLSKVSVQMKLTVFSETAQEEIDQYRANISNFANSQNSIQGSDLVSNHPIHLNIERLSRQIQMPRSETGLPSKWFYERTRGQYSTKLRALGGSAASKFKQEYPKHQLFTKTDMAKYINTWRMRPHIVKKGAQANLKILGPELVKEYEADPVNFEGGFYRELIAQAILFKVTDKAVLKSDWYQDESGFKAEAVTFGIAILRHKLVAKSRDINLEKIFNQQTLSESMRAALVEAAHQVRKAINNPSFRGGVSNPSEFCKSENGWKRIQTLEVDLSSLSKDDVVGKAEREEAKSEARDLNKTSKSLNDFEVAMSFGAGYWKALASFNLKRYRLEEIQVAVPSKCAIMLEGRGRPLSPKQLKAALKLSAEAEAAGFSFVK